MGWTHERVSPALSEHATASESTYLASQHVGTLHDGTYVDTTTNPTTKLGISTVSTNPTIHSATTYVAIPTTTMSIHAITPTYPTVSSNTTMLTGHPIHLSLSTSVNCNSKIEPDVPGR
jgi:hypothetical protein